MSVHFEVPNNILDIRESYELQGISLTQAMSVGFKSPHLHVLHFDFELFAAGR